MNLCCVINSHLKCINSLDVDSKNGIILTGSEDTHLNVWKVQTSENSDDIKSVVSKGSYHLDD